MRLGYGPYAYGFYGPVGYAGLPPAYSPTQLRFVAPEEAQDVVLEQPQANVFRYTFRSEQPLDEVYTFYHEMFMEQNFERTSGELGESGGEFTYTQNGAEIGFTIESMDEDRYEVVYDLQGLAAEQAAAN